MPSHFQRTSRSVIGVEVLCYPEHLFRNYVFEYSNDYQCGDIAIGYSVVEDGMLDTIDEFGNILDYDKVVNAVERACLDLQHDWAYLHEGDLLNYAFNLHDQDKNSDGSYIKNHFHVYLWTEDGNHPISQTFTTVIANRFGYVKVFSKEITKRKRTYTHYYLGSYTYLINPIKQLCCALRYLIHCDNNDKYKYKLEDCVSNVNLFHHKAFMEMTQVNEVTFLCDAALSGRINSYHEMFIYARDNGLLDVFLRQKHFFHDFCSSLGGNNELNFGKKTKNKLLTQEDEVNGF